MDSSRDRSLTQSEQELVARAHAAGASAYCPYSRFPVGAAVRTEKGVFRGCNIENASYGLSMCAERVALFAAVAAGATRISMIAVACLRVGGGAVPGSRMPCGACRQVITEFMQPGGLVLVEGVGKWRVADLLPDAFVLLDRPFFSQGADADGPLQTGSDTNG